MMNVSALAGGALLCAVLFVLTTSFIPEIDAGFRAVRDAIRAPATRTVARLAAIAALGSAVITGGVSLGYASPLARESGDVAYLPSLAIRADGRLALADGVSLADAARAYAGPGDYWRSTCRATLPGWRSPVDWSGVDALGRPLWRASISGSGVVEVSGLGAAEADPLRALLSELAIIVACE